MSDKPAAASTPDLTEGGQRLAASYAHTTSLVDQVTRAAEAGDWPVLVDVAGELSLAADELAAAAALVTTEERATGPADMLSAAEARTSPAS
ncbi:hypothetical protein [Streptacidiphilus sp. BW17]|uniref:hypothetical protein n=1 Tax=unclassified Streptacidiphilus TaxID=2643834 RepID=UPI003517DB42